MISVIWWQLWSKNQNDYSRQFSLDEQKSTSDQPGVMMAPKNYLEQELYEV